MTRRVSCAQQGEVASAAPRAAARCAAELCVGPARRPCRHPRCRRLASLGCSGFLTGAVDDLDATAADASRPRARLAMLLPAGSSRPGSDTGGSHQSPAAVKVWPVPARNPARAELPAMVRVAGLQIASNSGQDAYLCASDFTKFNEVTKSNF